MGGIRLGYARKLGGKASTLATSRHIHDDVVMDILSRLRVKTLLQFKLVCKSWFSLITSSEFIKMHLKKTYDSLDYVNHKVITHRRKTYKKQLMTSFSLHSILPKPSYKASRINIQDGEFVPHFIVGSCNGLICMVDRHANLVLSNPSIRQFSRVLIDNYYMNLLMFDFPYRAICYGFYYDENNDDYKIMILENYKPENVSTKLWTSKTKFWKDIQVRPKGLITTSCGIVMNGKLHWLLDKDTTFTILSLDLESEVFSELSMPNGGGNNVIEPILTIYKGFLSLVFPYEAEQQSIIYIMKEYGDISSWEKELVVPHVKCPWPWYRRWPLNNLVYTFPLCILANGEIILLSTKQFQKMGRLMSRVSSQEVRQITQGELYVLDANFFYFRMHTYIESLVSPRAITKYESHRYG